MKQGTVPLFQEKTGTVLSFHLCHLQRTDVERLVMKETDKMELPGFLCLQTWKKKARQRFIDEAWPGVKPG